MEITFEELNIPTPLLDGLKNLNFIKPTEIQEKSLPFSLEGRDILALAPTGSGKTGAFIIPLLSKMIKDFNTFGLILAPTRELAIQISKFINQLNKSIHIDTALLVGGEPIGKQFFQLKKNPNIIIATPGRLKDHIERGLNLKKFNFLVLDEADRMLDMGFKDEIHDIIQKMSTEKQTLMFTATLRKSIIDIAQKYLNNPYQVTIERKKESIKNIKQDFIHTSHDNKYTDFISELKKRIEYSVQNHNQNWSIIIFVNTKKMTEHLKYKIQQDLTDHDAECLHGDYQQKKRAGIVNSFRNGKFKILIATDVVARGLDIPHIAHVVNYDIPKNPEDYTHRIGRTGREGGTEGSSICFVTPHEKKQYQAISGGLTSDDIDLSFKKFPSKRRGNFNPRGNKFSNSNYFGRDKEGSSFEKKRRFFNKDKKQFGSKTREFKPKVKKYSDY